MSSAQQPVTHVDAIRLQNIAAEYNQGKIPKGSLAAKANAAADYNMNLGEGDQPILTGDLKQSGVVPFELGKPSTEQSQFEQADQPWKGETDEMKETQESEQQPSSPSIQIEGRNDAENKENDQPSNREESNLEQVRLKGDEQQEERQEEELEKEKHQSADNKNENANDEIDHPKASMEHDQHSEELQQEESRKNEEETSQFQEKDNFAKEDKYVEEQTTEKEVNAPKEPSSQQPQQSSQEESQEQGGEQLTDQSQDQGSIQKGESFFVIISYTMKESSSDLTLPLFYRSIYSVVLSRLLFLYLSY